MPISKRYEIKKIWTKEIEQRLNNKNNHDLLKEEEVESKGENIELRKSKNSPKDTEKKEIKSNNRNAWNAEKMSIQRVKETIVKNSRR